MNCPDLREAFPAYRWYRSADHIEGLRLDPWNLELRSPKGARLWPHGPGEVQLYVGNQPIIRNRIRDAGVRVHQWGDEEATFRLTPAEAEPWLEALGFYKRRVLTEVQLAAMTARLPRPAENDSREP